MLDDDRGVGAQADDCEPWWARVLRRRCPGRLHPGPGLERVDDGGGEGQGAARRGMDGGGRPAPKAWSRSLTCLSKVRWNWQSALLQSPAYQTLLTSHPPG